MSSGQESLDLTMQIGGSRFELRDGHRYTVGSAEDCDLRVNHHSIAARHCEVSLQNGLAVVRDLGSESGTFVDDRRIEKQVILPGQTLRFGSIGVDLVAPEDASTGSLPVLANRRDRFAPASFPELMASELKRAPWFTLSAVIHFTVILILYYLMEEAAGAPKEKVSIVMSQSDETSEDEENAASPPATVVEPEQEVLEQLGDPFETDDSGDEASISEQLELGPSGLARAQVWMETLRTGATGSDDLLRGASAPFRDQAVEDRRKGLEIVFVFDSTSTMGEMIHATKRRIEAMVEVLHSLVPSARIGVVTYRDRGPSEEYLTRHVPLGRDVYRLINFMQVVEARDGDDRPEAVLDGLREAFAQLWHRRSRRVVVLIGDAPAHAYDETKIGRVVRDFAKDGRSSVHSIVVSPYGGGVVLDDALRSFKKIADQGGGKCLRFENESLIMQQVLSLAFGTEYRADLDRVAEVVQKRRTSINPEARDVLRRQDVEEIHKQLQESVIPDDLVKGLAQSEDKLIAKSLVDVLELPGFSEAARQASAYALARILNGQLETAVRQILESAGREGADPRRQPWTLGMISSRKARFLRQLIDEV